jgi:tagatose 1,6-diphosphate aldolase
LDPIYGIPAINSIKDKCGLLISLEESGYEESEEGRLTRLIKNFGPKEAKELGANAVKLLIYFNPKAKTARQQEELVKKISEECRKVGLPFVCEFLVYPYKEKKFEEEKSELILSSAKTISRLGIDLLKTEFPGRLGVDKIKEIESNCKKLKRVSKVPWVLLSRGIDFDQFKQQLKIAMRFGASGFMVGRALWQDYFSLGKQKEAFLKEVCLKRLKELKEIAS